MRALKNGETELVLDPEAGFIERQVFEKLRGPADTILERMASETAISLKAIANIGGVILNASSKGGAYSVWGAIPSIWINGKFRTIADGKALSPDFWTPQNSRIALKLEWQAPETMKLWWLSMFDRPNGNYRHTNSYMVASSTAEGRKGWFLPPIANIFDDGRLCMGDAPVEGDATLAGAWSKATARFFNAQFNAHLSDRIAKEHVEKIISFDASSNKQLPVAKNWEEMCRRANSTIYNCITV